MELSKTIQALVLSNNEPIPFLGFILRRFIIMKKQFFTILSLITVLCSLLVGCGDLSYATISSNHPTDTIAEDPEDPLPEQADSLSGQNGSMESSENVSDTTSTDDTIDIPEEYLSENSGIEYTVNENGEYVYDGMLFRHKLVLTSRAPTDKHFISIYIVLTNDTELTAEKIFKDSICSKGISPNDLMQEYPSYFYVVVGNHVYEEPH